MDDQKAGQGSEVERDWTTEAGLRAVVLMVRGSHRCGYVEVPEDHPLQGVEYNEEADVISFNPDEVAVGKRSPILLFTASVGASDGKVRRSPDIAFDVHGGLTYSGSGDNGYPVESEGWWFGFDCSHYGDGSLDPDMPSSGPVRSEEYVARECERLAEQIVDMCPLERLEAPHADD